MIRGLIDGNAAEIVVRLILPRRHAGLRFHACINIFPEI
jgi:hypothetical protein